MAYHHHFAGWGAVLVLGLVVYLLRVRLFHVMPRSIQLRMEQWMPATGATTVGGAAGGSIGRSLYARLPTYDWQSSRLAGLHSTLFDIEANIRDGDTRTGLEAAGAQEIERLMTSEGVDFDTARLMLNQHRFSKNNIDPRTGMPLDSKAVTFENLQ